MKRKKLRLRPPTYQPKRAELRERHKIDAMPQQIAQAVLSPVDIVYRDQREDATNQGRPRSR